MFKIRKYLNEDLLSVQSIVTEATKDLRLVYAPKKKCKINENENLEPLRYVAITDDGLLVGVAEYTKTLNIFYVQGLAVRSSSRKEGVARALLSYISTIGNREGVTTIEIKTIEETGNCEIFEKLGFIVSSRTQSENFLGIKGQPVIEVVMNCDVS
ncbi:MAG: GNAT family N-acetyltransferase [Candidatus Sedimenticola sp. (ex Thyasira tokunagai)]